MKQKRPYGEALAEAQAVLLELLTACDKAVIAGSIRRKKAECGDIEIVCTPIMISDLLGNKMPAISMIRDWCERAGKLQKDGERYKQILLQSGTQLDLFITYAPAQWGVNLLIRTGDSEFSQLAVTQANKGGFLPSYLHIEHGAVWHGETLVPTPTETDFLKLLGLEGLPPEKRTAADARAWRRQLKLGDK